VPRSWKSRAIPLPTLWATTGHVTGTLYLYFLTEDIITLMKKDSCIWGWWWWWWWWWWYSL